MDQDSLFQILYRPLYIPVTFQDDKTPSPAVFDITDHNLVLGFSSALGLAMFCGEGADYIEMTARELFGKLAESQIGFGFNFGLDDAVLYENNQLNELLALAERDTIIEAPASLKFETSDFSEDFIDALSELAPSAQSIALCGEASIGKVVCVSQDAIDNSGALLGKLYDVVVSMGDDDNVTIMPCADLSELDASFQTYAKWIEPKVQPKLPPKLR